MRYDDFLQRDEFEKKMTQLLELLKSIMKHSPTAQSQFMNLFEGKPGDKMTVNFCFFNFIPVTPEEMEEFEDLYGDIADSHEANEEEGDFFSDFKWTKSDVEFLKRHGMSF